MRRVFFCILALVMLLLPAYAQQSHINQVIVFTGYSYLNTPLIGLGQNGFNGSLGMNYNRWLGLGTDFSVFTGSTGLGFSSTTLGTTLAPIAPAQLMPVLATLSAPISANTFTWAVGPKFNLRKWKKVTLFAHPGFGLMHETANINLTSLNALLTNPTVAPLLATPQGQATVATLLSKFKVQLGAATSSLTDTVPFYGAGAGFDINASRHVGLRFSADWVRSHMFDNLLAWQNNVRLSVGATWGFGEVNQAKK
jgi:hypothetical protein